MSQELLLVQRLFGMLVEVPNITQDAEGVIAIGDICIAPIQAQRRTLKGSIPVTEWQVWDANGEECGVQYPTFSGAAVEALQEYVEMTARGKLDELAQEGAAAAWQEEQNMLKKAYSEGFDASKDKTSDPPYPYGTDFYNEWVKGYKAGQEIKELCKPY